MHILLLLLLTDWARFGGPSGDFQLPAGEIQQWPEKGPRLLWKKALGDGYSGIAVADGGAFTMHRAGGREVVTRFDAETGAVRWEYSYEAPVPASLAGLGGEGPRATPLVTGGRVITAGANGKVHCLDAQSGKKIWERGFAADFGGVVRNSGYSVSPFGWRDMVILFPGGRGGSIVALRQKDGTVAWRKHALAPAFSTPVMVRLAGREQMVVALAEEVAGFDADSGDLLWKFAHGNSEQVNVAQPVVVGEGRLFVSSAYDGQCRVIAVEKNGSGFAAREVWSNRLMRVHHGNVVAMGGMVLGANGDFGPVPLTAVDAASGKLLWRDRTFPKATMVKMGERVLILDEEGTLALAVPRTGGLEVLGKAAVLHSTSWTPPAVVGTRVFVRDRKEIAAYSLLP